MHCKLLTFLWLRGLKLKEKILTFENFFKRALQIGQILINLTVTKSIKRRLKVRLLVHSEGSFKWLLMQIKDERFTLLHVCTQCVSRSLDFDNVSKGCTWCRSGRNNLSNRQVSMSDPRCISKQKNSLDLDISIYFRILVFVF